MKVLIVNSVAEAGSTGKIAKTLYDQLLQKGHESILCYGRGEKFKNRKGFVRISTRAELYLHVVLARITGYQGRFSFFSTRKLLKTIKEFNPDVVHLFNLHGYYVNEFKLLNFLKEQKIKTVYSMLDEYPYMGKCTYSFDCEKYVLKCRKCPQTKAYPKSLFFDRAESIFNLKKEAYMDFNDIVFTAPAWVLNRASASALIGHMKLVEIDEFTDTEATFYPRDTSELRDELKIPSHSRVALFVASFTDHRKGGKYYLDLARKLENKNMVFIHVGYDGKNISLPTNYIPVRYVRNQDVLAQYYSLADVFVCTSLADTMPNVCLESLACGTPICGFDASGTPFVATPEFGKFTPVFDTNALSVAVNSVEKKTSERSESCRNYAKERYSKQTFISKVLSVYTDI